MCEVFHAYTTSVDSSLDCRLCHRLSEISSRDVPLCRLFLRQPGILVIQLYWTCLVACSPSMLEHCCLGTWRAPLGSPLCVHGASLPRHWPHGFTSLMLFASVDYLLHFLVHAGIISLVQTQFIPGPLFLDH